MTVVDYRQYQSKHGGQLLDLGGWLHGGNIFNAVGYCRALDCSVKEYIERLDQGRKPTTTTKQTPAKPAKHKPAPKHPERKKINTALSGEIETPGAMYWQGVESAFFEKIQSIDMTHYELEQDDAGRLFVDVFADCFRYNATRKGFMVWAGNRWVPDIWKIAERAAALVAKHIQVKMVETEPDDLRRAAAFVSKIRTTSGINAILFFAASDPRITTTQEDYNQNQHLLNTPGGTYELDTGTMREHRRADLITKLTEYTPDFQRKPVMFSDFLDKITCGREDLKEALQVYAGSGCSGKFPKDKLALCQGSGANGKTAFLEAVADTLGDYAARLNIKHLTQDDKDSSSGHSDELASLAGSRFVISVESQQDRRLNEAAVKKFTGGDGVAVSFKHGHTFIMHPAFTLFVLTNHRPRITGRDTGIWRRMALFPFDYKVPDDEKDLDFKVKLTAADGPAIMAWLIAGCRKWYASGYGNFQTVNDATGQYKSDEDTIGRFIEERCTTGKGFSVQANELRTAFEKWCDENGERVFSGRAWREALEERGLRREHDRIGNTWKGIALNISDDEEIPF